MSDSFGEAVIPAGHEYSVRRDAEELHVFHAGLEQRRPRVTIALMAVISVVFALQALWGGVDLPPLLARMGSLIPDRARNGEWWRFLSCTFLHGGALHAALNLFVLWMIGRFLERVVGSVRFAILYLLAGLAGSACSSFFVTSQSVGASGAIWGLLGAEAALVFYPRPLLPRVLLPAARRIAVVNLVLNLLNSLNPHVDVAAHVGGGLMGVLAFFGIAALGLPELGRPRGGRLLQVAATALALLFGSGLVVAILRGRPWELTSHTDSTRVMMEGSGWTVKIPEGLAPSHDVVAGRASRFGNLAYDPCAVDITWTELPRQAGEAHAPAADDELALIRQQLLTTTPAGLEEIRPPEVIDNGARRWVGARYRYTSNPEVIYDRAIGLKEGRLILVNVTAWEALPGSHEGLAPLILQSISPATTDDPARQQPPR